MQNVMTDSPLDRPASRYGAPQRSRRTRRWVIVGLFAAVVVLAGPHFAFWPRSRCGTMSRGKMPLDHDLRRLLAHFMASCEFSWSAVVDHGAMRKFDAE